MVFEPRVKRRCKRHVHVGVADLLRVLERVEARLACLPPRLAVEDRAVARKVGVVPVWLGLRSGAVSHEYAGHQPVLDVDVVVEVGGILGEAVEVDVCPPFLGFVAFALAPDANREEPCVAPLLAVAVESVEGNLDCQCCLLH